MSSNPVLRLLEAPVDQIEQFLSSEGATPPLAWSSTEVEGSRAWFEAPLARINIEVDTPVGVADAWLLVLPEGGLLVRTGSNGDIEMAQLVRHSLPDIPMVLANFVDLGPRPTAKMAAFAVPTRSIDGVPVDADSALAVMKSLTAQNVGGNESAAVAILMSSRRATWRLTVASRRPGQDVSSLQITVLDAGSAGLWGLQIAADELRLRPLKPSEVLTAIVAMLKQTLELQE